METALKFQTKPVMTELQSQMQKAAMIAVPPLRMDGIVLVETILQKTPASSNVETATLLSQKDVKMVTQLLETDASTVSLNLAFTAIPLME